MNDPTPEIQGGDLNATLDKTAASLPPVMPTAEILQRERENVNANEPTPSQVPEKRGRGRPRKTPNTETTAKPVNSGGFIGGVNKPVNSAEEFQALPEEQQLLIASAMAVGLIEQSGAMLGGDAAKMQKTEKDGMTTLTAAYLQSKQIKDIPVGMLLAGSVVMYYGRVLKIEDHQKISTAAKIGFWLKNKMKRKVKHNAPINSRNDGERQDNAG